MSGWKGVETKTRDQKKRRCISIYTGAQVEEGLAYRFIKVYST